MARVSRRDEKIWSLYSLLPLVACLIVWPLIIIYAFNMHSVSNYGATNHASVGNDINAHQDLSSYGSFSSYGSAADLHLGHGLNAGNVQHTFAQSVPISEHVEVTKPVAVPVIKNIGKVLQTTL